MDKFGTSDLVAIAILAALALVPMALGYPKVEAVAPPKAPPAKGASAKLADTIEEQFKAISSAFGS